MTGCLVSIIVVCFMASVFAQTPFDVSGIVSGPDPLAIINGKVLRVGEMVEGARVTAIGVDKVTLQSGDGKIVEARLKPLEEKPRKSPSSTPGAGMGTTPMAVGSPEEKGRRFEAPNIQAANECIYQAEQLLGQRVVSVAGYEKALSLYDQARTQLQFAFERNLDVTFRRQVKESMVSAQKTAETITRRKIALAESIEEAKKGARIVLGMTKSDVLQSWGSAEAVSKGRFTGVASDEQWMYGKLSRGAKFLYFKDGVLMAVQNTIPAVNDRGGP